MQYTLRNDVYAKIVNTARNHVLDMEKVRELANENAKAQTNCLPITTETNQNETKKNRRAG